MKKKFWIGLAAGLFLLITAGMANATVINFDDTAAPDFFSYQTPLAEEYSHIGVHFTGSGAVLNSNSNFRVALGWPFTAPNFLAFNVNNSPFPPETIDFDFYIDYFSLDFAGSTGTVILTAFNNGVIVDSLSTISSTGNEWSTLFISNASGFDKVVFTVADTDGAFVVDNLNFNETSPVPLPPSILLFGTGILGLAASGIRRKRK